MKTYVGFQGIVFVFASVFVLFGDRELNVVHNLLHFMYLFCISVDMHEVYVAARAPHW